MEFGAIYVLAKTQICQCFATNDEIFDKLREKATKSCSPKFHCYQRLLHYYCEATQEKRPEFDACCRAYNAQLVGSSCRHIKDNFWSNEFVPDPYDYTINETLKGKKD